MGNDDLSDRGGIGANRIMINGSKINSYEVPYEIGSRQRTALLLTGPLLFRFGKAQIPKFKPDIYKPGPVNRYLEVWRTLGIKCEFSIKDWPAQPI